MPFLSGIKTEQEELSELKELTENGGFLGLAQINPVAGDIEYNAITIAKYIKYATSIKLDMVVFPEMTLIGYPVYDTIERYPFLVDENIKWLKALAEITRDTAVIVGFIEPAMQHSEGKNYYNSLAILKNGEIQGIVRKSLLPNYNEFNDCRHFEQSPVIGIQPAETLCKFSTDKVVSSDGIYTLKGIKYGITIGEDLWNNKYFFGKNLYAKDPVSELKKAGAEVIINCSASPSRARKDQLKHNMLAFTSFSQKLPIVYVNQVGAIDNISFDGGSRAINKYGNLFACAKSFEEDFIIVNPLKAIGETQPARKELEKLPDEQKTFTLEYEPDLERTYKTVIQGIKDYFSKCGLKRAVLGLSGGLDSSVSAVLLADALGKENVFGVSMPSKLTSNESKNDAKDLAENLGINFAEISIKPMVETTTTCLNELFKDVETKWQDRYKHPFTPDNIQARARAVYLWGISNEFPSCIPIATSDKSELYMGYATVNGDMSGGFAPIADIPKTKLFALARWMNENREEKNAIPISVINKKPGAELAINPETGKTLNAEDALMPYEFLDEIIWRTENKNEAYKELYNAEFIYEKNNHITKKQKIEWLNKFFGRMSKGLYKWTIMPPSVIVDSHSINRAEYIQPITSGRINYKGHSKAEIRNLIKAVID